MNDKPALKILISESHSGVARMLHDDIAKMAASNQQPVEITLEPNAQKALALLKAERFDALLTDNIKPGQDINGLELIKQARSGGASKDMAVIMETLYPNAQLRMEAQKIGVQAVLEKGEFDDAKLWHTIIDAIADKTKTGQAPGA